VGTDLFTVELQEAEAALVEAEANYERTRQLFERQAVPRQELITYTSRYEAAKARVASAELRVERSIIKAPISGVAIDRLVEAGEVVSPLSRITTLHQVSRLKANVGIPETDISYFQVGGEASVEADAYPGKEFEGRIHFIGPAATGKNRTFPAEVALDNRSGELRPGMIAPVSLVKRRYKDAVVIPRDAILDRVDGSVAFVANGEHAKERPVVLGPSEGNRIVVLEGLAVGQELVVSGHRNLVDGQPVRVVE
jgi:membrane fusion protein (multidrug efflux system)